jgi:hypothetical protein
MSDPITICDLADFRLGHKAENGQDFYDANLNIMGGCQVCHASIAAYNAFPSKTGYWRCKDCIGDLGFHTAQEAHTELELQYHAAVAFEHGHAGTSCKYLGNDAWDCGYLDGTPSDD